MWFWKGDGKLWVSFTTGNQTGLYWAMLVLGHLYSLSEHIADLKTQSCFALRYGRKLHYSCFHPFPFSLPYFSLGRTLWTDGWGVREWCYMGQISLQLFLSSWLFWANGGRNMLATSGAPAATVNEAKNSNLCVGVCVWARVYLEELSNHCCV